VASRPKASTAWTAESRRAVTAGGRETAVSTNWSEPQLGGTTNSPVQIVEWWKTFNDAELDSLVERAVKANYNLRLTVGSLHEARATVSGAEWDFTPTIGNVRL